LLRMPAWLGVGCGALIVWRVLRELKGWPLPGRTVTMGLTVAGVAGIFAAYQTLLGQQAGVALLTIMLCLKLLEMRTLRDAMLVIFLGYFLVISGFLFSQSIFVGIYMFAVVLALTAALVALNHPGGAQRHSRGYVRLAGGLLLQSVPLMLVLFILFPRIPGPLWALPEDAHQGTTGLSDELTLGSITSLAESQEVAFRVQFDGEPPAADRLYWRGPVLWLTDGRGWRVLDPEGERVGRLGDAGYQDAGKTVDYEVTIEPHNRKWLFALDLPTGAPPAANIRGDFQMVADKPVNERRRYSMRSVLDYNTGELSSLQRQLGLDLPAGSNPQTTALARRWREEGMAPEAIISAALSFFRDQPFYYTRQPPALPADNAVDSFLFDRRRGFCEHYAASFITLMRAARIPARLVTGYQGGQFNPVGDYLIIRQADAHAWAEVWLEDQGWVRVDPTAVVPPERVQATADTERFRSTLPLTLSGAQADWLARSWQQMSASWDAANHTWNQWVLGFDQERQRDLIRRLGLGDIDWRGMVGMLFLSLLVLLGGVGAYLLWPRRAKTDPAARFYERFCRKLDSHGLPRQRDEGPRAYAERVLVARPDLTGPIQRITDLYTRIRYADDDPDRWLPHLKDQVQAFRP
ncbi:transglutaminase TgpA family protein, partial [Thiohalomonas denitrificans]|uniref:transglutaminase TgpA family protein n=1 Tax=Thiohalomonas denitrificans TaxID=415747 RepID=UPI0026EF6BD3